MKKRYRKPITATGKRGFLEWIKRDMPDAYQKIAKQRPDLLRINESTRYRPGSRAGIDVSSGWNYDLGNYDLHGLGEWPFDPPGTDTVLAPDSADPWYKDIGKALATAGTVYLNVKQQRELQKINARRAQQGLPPVASQPTVTGSVDIGDKTRSMITGLAVPAMIGLAAFTLLPKLMGR